MRSTYGLQTSDFERVAVALLWDPLVTLRPKDNVLLT